MRKALLIMAAALMTMTQCRKQETMPVTPSADTIKMTVTAGPGRTDISTETGAITWSAGDKLYVSKNGSWLGCLELVSGENTANGTFAGDVTGIGDGDTPCHFFYLGKGNIATTPTGTAAVSISLASQDGTLRGENGAMKYHMGYGRTDVTVTEGEATGYVEMNTKIAIAHINFTTDGTTAYTGAVTMGGTGISNTLSVSPNGNFSGSGTDGITIGGTTGERYVTLIPTGTTDVLNVAFTGDATGGMTFANGIEANKFYGMKDAIAVTVEAAAPAAVFSVADGTTVEFAPGNLYWDGSADNKWKFEANQYDFRTYSGKGSCINGEYSSSSGTPTNDWGLFGWSGSDKDHYGKITSQNNSDYSGNEIKDWGGITDLPSAGDGKTWRTLSKAEWEYLLGFSSSCRANASNLRAWVTLTDVKVSGLVILPDGSTATAKDVDTKEEIASSGAVFLPASGYRGGEILNYVGSYGDYWSSTFNGTNNAYYVYFGSGDVGMSNSGRNVGYAVRLVR